MKVYAQYFKVKDIEYRLNTILQFGDSWELIGNVVLANPGSSMPLERISILEEQEVRTFYRAFEQRDYSNNNWFKFRPDTTMRIIEKIFNGYYVNKKECIELKGVIQLFNTFNVRNQNLVEAVNNLPEKNQQLYSCGIEKFFQDKPTYFGFSQSILKNHQLKIVAEDIFNSSSNTIKDYYKPSFEENLFYHPMFVGRSYQKSFFQSYKKQVLVPLFNSVKIIS